MSSFPSKADWARGASLTMSGGPRGFEAALDLAAQVFSLKAFSVLLWNALRVGR